MPLTKNPAQVFTASPPDATHTPSRADAALLLNEVIGGAIDQWLLALGSAAAPSLTFLGRLSTGIYSSAANTIDFATNGIRAMLIDVNGSVLLRAGTGALGYGTGAGFSVTQATSRTTTVVSARPSGAITMFTAAGSATWAEFEVTCTLMEITDTVVISQRGGTNDYEFRTRSMAGAFKVGFRTTGGTASDAPIVNYAIIRAASA